jgi:hypothetical protein
MTKYTVEQIEELIGILYDVHGKDAVVDFAGNCALRAYYNTSAFAASYAEHLTDSAANADDAIDIIKNAYNASVVSASVISDYAAATVTAECEWQIDYLVEAINE